MDARLSVWRRLIDDELDTVLPRLGTPPQTLHEAMRHAVFPGGKRVRPLLVLSTAVSIGRSRNRAGRGILDDLERAMPCALAVELIHSYSLVHDDLPAMDDDDFRRGHPTVHKAFGEALAILAGDALLSLAFQVLSSPKACALMGAEAACKAVWELAQAASSAGMVGGQAVDISAAPWDAGLEYARLLADLKTGALIRASVRCGAIVSGADEAELDVFTRFAESYGRAFQVFDDLQDVAEDRPREGGRHAMMEERGFTFPRALGVEGAREYARGLMERASETLSEYSGDARELAHLARTSVGLG